MSLKTLLRSVLYLASLGLAVHLVVPRIPGIERSFVLISTSSGPLIWAAFLAIFGSYACYAEILGRTVGATTGLGASARSRKRQGLGRWFMFRLTVAEHGASKVLPGGGSAAAAVTYAGLRLRGLKPTRGALAVATTSVIVYGTLAAIFLASLVYLILDHELNRAATAASVFALFLTFCALLLATLSYRSPNATRRFLTGVLYRAGRLLLRRRWSRRQTELKAARIVLGLQSEVRALREQLLYHPVAAARLFALAVLYWAFDAACLFLIFVALGVPTGGIELFVAFGVATTFGSLPLTPGGLGVVEATLIGTLALLGAGPEVAIPVLGYRLFNFWLPIPLAAILYPTLSVGSAKYTRGEGSPNHRPKVRRKKPR
ncbi:MAG: hypothetical protein CYG60_14635 [Actinobacteria bacterium]|nr:MAG: hypothetical protein CYG60_14635 [Actinomycetota bacterium]